MSNSQIKKVEGIPNLYVDNKTGIYLVRIYHAGANRSKSLKVKSLTVAKQKIAGAIRDIVTTDKKKLRNKLVKDYTEGFFDALRSEEIADNSVKVYDIAMRHHILPFWGEVADNQITQEKYTDFISWHKKVKNSSLFNAHKTFNKLISHMKSKGAAIGAIDIYLPKKEKDNLKTDKGTYISDEEIARVFLEIQGDSARERLQIELAYCVGMRIGEIANLKKDSLSVKGDEYRIQLKAIETKTRRARIVPLPKDLGARLLAYIDRTDSKFVFPAHRNYKHSTSPQVIERAWKDVLRLARIRRRIRFHDLRHTCATNMAAIGVDPVKACAILGMSLKMYEVTYVKKHKLNLSSVAELLSLRGPRP